MKKRELKRLLKLLRKDNRKLTEIIRRYEPDFRSTFFKSGTYAETIKFDENSLLTIKRISKPMTQMTERTKKVADFLQANEGTFTPTEIEAATGVNFRGVVTIVRALDKNYGMPELASRVVSRVKRMKMVAIPQV